jgi:glycerol-3-phosphate acyltransferase PlsY
LLGMDAASTAALCAFLGHVFPVTQKFKGGKGVATAFGTLLGIDPLMGLCCLAVAAVFVLITKRMSVGSILAAASCPLFAWFMAKGFFAYGIIMAAVIIVKHRSNIVRLIHGEEPKLSFKK